MGKTAEIKRKLKQIKKTTEKIVHYQHEVIELMNEEFNVDLNNPTTFREGLIEDLLADMMVGGTDTISEIIHQLKQT